MPGFEIGKRKFQIDAGKIFYLRHGKCFESSWNPADKKNVKKSCSFMDYNDGKKQNIFKEILSNHFKLNKKR